MTKGNNQTNRLISLEQFIPVLLAVILVLVLGYRATLGVDFTDESYHVANAYKFYLGAIPFKDEMFSAQGFALLTKPLLSAFISITGSSEAIVLEMRLAFLFFQLLISLFLFSILNKTFSRSLAFAACLSYFCFIPMNLFSLFYVTLGVGFLAIGIGCFYLASFSETPSKSLVLGSFSLALSFIAHPVMAVPIIVMAGFISWPFDKLGLKRFFTVSFSLVFLIAMFFVLYGFSPTDWLHAVQGSRNYNAGLGNVWGFERVFFAFKTLVMWGPWLGFVLATFAFFVLASFKKTTHSRITFGFLALFPFLIFLNSRSSTGGIGPAGYLLSFSWLTSILIWSTLPFEQAKKYFIWFLIPSTTAALAMAFTSNSGVASTSTGFLPLLPLSLLIFISALRNASLSFWKGSYSLINILIIGLFLFVLVRGTFQSAFKEPAFSELTHPISQGPFRGLKTNKFRKDFIEALHNHLNEVKSQKKSILFTCFFPAGYLLTDLKPGYFFVWGAPGKSDQLFGSDVLVRVLDKSYPLLGIVDQTCEPLKEEIEEKKGVILKKDFYEIGLF